MAAGALAIATLVLWPHAEEPSEARTGHAASSPHVSTNEPPSLAAPARATPDAIGQRPEVIDIGLGPAEVERLAGAPMFRSRERWEYGPSEILFTDGKVSGWHSSPLRPLPVADIDPHSARAD